MTQIGLKAVVNAYESELDTTVKEVTNPIIQANNIISKYKEAADRANKNEELERELKKIQDTVEREKEKSYQEFEKYKRTCEDRESKQSTEANRKLR